MTLALPPHVQRRIDLERRAEYWAGLKRNFTTSDPRCEHYSRELQRRYGKGIFLVKANDTVEAGVPLRPGYFHLMQIPQDAPPWPTPLTNNGKYVEPGDWIFDRLGAGNLREQRVRDAIAREEQEDAAAYEREKADQKQNRMERVKDIVDSATKVRVSMNDRTPWTQGVAGRRGRST
jgi:hypothetical protein